MHLVLHPTAVTISVIHVCGCIWKYTTKAPRPTPGSQAYLIQRTSGRGTCSSFSPPKTSCQSTRPTSASSSSRTTQGSSDKMQPPQPSVPRAVGTCLMARISRTSSTSCWSSRTWTLVASSGLPAPPPGRTRARGSPAAGRWPGLQDPPAAAL